MVTTNQNPQNESVERLDVLNDEAVAHALAEKYMQHGLDPNLAYSRDDDVNFHEEFGI